uniref:Stress response protein nst1 n=1 Tax=Anthurium amnicola TaxID=1678845 RepID=A0A1D1ZDS6_9ARAE
MCVICVLRRWSRRVIGVLPWLLIPLVGLWALSQLLPLGFQFEITSPRLACVVVLLGTLFWYEVLLPQLSVYQARRSARIRERQQEQAVELQKLRKTATRRCRNCFTPYREQKPGGGKFTCSYCGHVSKRPVLDLPLTPGGSGIISNLIWNNSWLCSQDSSAESMGSPAQTVSRNWVMGGEGKCLTVKSYSEPAVFNWNLLSSFSSCVSWFSERIRRLSSCVEDCYSGTEHNGLSKAGEKLGSYQESKGEKARRKAEEKRLARLEKEMLEEEEKKQREDVAKLIEERRKIRDEKLESEKERLKGLASDGERDGRKESEKRRQNRRRENDKNSSKNNIDVEDHEKRGIRETEKNHESERNILDEKRDPCNPRIKNQEVHMEVVNGVKGVTNKSQYLDRTSSRSFNRTIPFGKGSHISSASVTKSSKPMGGFVDQMRRRECRGVGHVIGKSLSNGDSNTLGTTYHQDTQTSTPKKSWNQLFTCSSEGSPCRDANAVERLNPICPPDVQISQLLCQEAPSHPLYNEIQFGQSSTYTAYPLMNGPLTGISATPLFAESRTPLAGEPGYNFTLDEAEISEDPCYVSDPLSLLGPVSESLDNFLVEAGSGHTADFTSDPSPIPKSTSVSADTNKPSSTGSPMSTLWLSEKMHFASGPCNLKLQYQSNSPGGECNNINGQGTWQMWSSSLCEGGPGFVGASANWLLPVEQNRYTHEEIIHPPSFSPMVSSSLKEENILQSTCNHSHNVHLGNCQNDCIMSSLTPILTENDPWLQGTLLHSFAGVGGNLFDSHNFNGSASQNEVACEHSKRSAASHPFDQMPAHDCSKDWPAHGGENIAFSDVTRPLILGLLSENPDVRSVWSLN